MNVRGIDATGRRVAEPAAGDANRGTCVVCRRTVGPKQETIRIRGLVVHLDCAMYRRRQPRG